MEDNRMMKNCYQAEICGDNGTWFSIVVAETVSEARDKCRKYYGKFHNKLHITITEQYDYFIE